jgi:ATP-dependent Lon protease
MIPFRGIGPFPLKKMAFKIGRKPSLKALEAALEGDGVLFLAAQHDDSAEDPRPGDVYRVGTLTNIIRYQKTPEGQVLVVARNSVRYRAVLVEEVGGSWQATLEDIFDPFVHSRRREVLIAKLLSLHDEPRRESPLSRLGDKVLYNSWTDDELWAAAEDVAYWLRLGPTERQRLLMSSSVVDLLERLIAFMEGADA